MSPYEYTFTKKKVSLYILTMVEINIKVYSNPQLKSPVLPSDNLSKKTAGRSSSSKIHPLFPQDLPNYGRSLHV